MNKEPRTNRPLSINSCPYRSFFLIFFLALVLTDCGYTNPYVSKVSDSSPTKTLMITTWQNRTNELGLESVYFRLFNSWFKNSSMIKVVFDEEQTDLKLNGEISAIDLPGLFYGPSEEALEIKIRLTVRFTLLDRRNNTVLWQEKQYTFSEPFLIDPTGERSEFNKQKALLRIGDDLAELIYLRTHDIVNNMP